jgi:apolipoprotein N-acyltransferase
MSSLTDVVPWRYLAVAAVVLLLGVGVALVGAWQLLVALAGGTTLLALLETAAPYLVALLLLALLEVAVVVAALVKVARAVSSEDIDIDGDRLRAAVERVRRRLSV